MAHGLSLTTAQNWGDMSHAERVAWYNFHGPQFERATGALVQALDAYAAAIKATGAHDALTFSTEQYINDALDAALRPLAPEVRDYVGV